MAPLLLSPVVLLVHGYHPCAGDAGIYVAGVRHILDPALYPLNAVFPAAFARLSIFPWTIAALARTTHLPLAWILLAAHLVSILLFLTACRMLAARLFLSERSRWCAVLLAAACFTLPVAGTALFVMDPYLTARSFSTPLSLMALAACIDRGKRAWLRAALLLILAALVHPLMAAYAFAFVLIHGVIAGRRTRIAVILCGLAAAAAGIAFLLSLAEPVSPAYREAVLLPAHAFLFLARWRWYEDLGLVLPLLLFALTLLRLPASSPIRTLCLTCLLVGTTSFAIAAFFVPASGPCLLVPLQPLRSFHLIYGAGVVLCGGILASVAARSRLSAWAAVALLFAGMFTAQRVAWSGSDALEWPWTQPRNPYQQAFLWIRGHTPRDAVFAFNPQLVYLPDEDEQGFRAMALRDHLADDKDAGIAAVIPALADRWAAQRNAALHVDGMTDAQRRATLTPLGVTWLLLAPGSETRFPCPWRNRVAVVCRIVPAA